MSDPNKSTHEEVAVPTGLGETSVPEVEIKLRVDDIEGSDDYVPSSEIMLPVGIMKDGHRYRKVVIEEMCGIDEHLVSSKDAQNNGAVASTKVICRCVQEVEGLLEQKKNPEAQFDRSLGRAMTQPDRDFILSRIQLLGGNNRAVMAGQCPRCNATWEEDTRLSDLPVNEWPEDKPTYIEFELERGVSHRDEKGKELALCKKGKLRFPTGKDQEMAGGLTSIAEQMDALLASCIFDLEEIGTLDQETVKRLKSRDRRYLMDLISRELPGLRQWKEVKCTCGKQMAITVDLTSFFEGRRRKQKT